MILSLTMKELGSEGDVKFKGIKDKEPPMNATDFYCAKMASRLKHQLRSSPFYLEDTPEVVHDGPFLLTLSDNQKSKGTTVQR